MDGQTRFTELKSNVVTVAVEESEPFVERKSPARRFVAVGVAVAVLSALATFTGLWMGSGSSNSFSAGAKPNVTRPRPSLPRPPRAPNPTPALAALPQAETAKKPPETTTQAPTTVPVAVAPKQTSKTERARAEAASKPERVAMNPNTGAQSRRPNTEAASQNTQKSASNSQPTTRGQTTPAASKAVVVSDSPRRAEALKDARKRSRELLDRYNEGKAALDRSEFSRAIGIFSQVLATDATFRDTAALLERAEAYLRAEAQSTLDQGFKRESDGDFKAALATYRQAQQIDPGFSRAGAAMAALQVRMKSMGEETFRRANAEDAFGRTSAAITLYQKAMDLLSDQDPTRLKAKQRLAVLQGVKP